MLFKVYDSVTKQYIDKDRKEGNAFISGFMVARNGKLYEVMSLGNVIESRERFVLELTKGE